MFSHFDNNNAIFSSLTIGRSKKTSQSQPITSTYLESEDRRQRKTCFSGLRFGFSKFQAGNHVGHKRIILGTRTLLLCFILTQIVVSCHNQALNCVKDLCLLFAKLSNLLPTRFCLYNFSLPPSIANQDETRLIMAWAWDYMKTLYSYKRWHY